VFWVTDALACWAGLATFGLHMNMAALFVGFATGMLFTRRTGPLAGAGVFAYRVLALLLPMPVSLAALPTLRKLAEG
jgi:predicted branched-subunit amino acid permease